MSSGIRVGVLVLGDLGRPGGTATRLLGITNHLADYGYDVVLFNCYPPPPELSDKVRNVLLKRRALPKRSLSLLFTLFPKPLFWLQYIPDINYLKRALRQQEINILHVHKHTPAYTALRLKAGVKVPVLFDVHGILRLQTGDLSLLGMSDRQICLHLKAEENVFKLADAVSVVSNRMRDYVIDHFNLTVDSVYVIPDAVDVDLFSKRVSEEEKAELRNRYGLVGKRVILFAGHFKKLGGIMDLLRAYRYLTNRVREPTALVLIGDGQLLPEVQRFKIQEGLNDLILVGLVPHAELPQYYAIADVLVVPEIASEYNDIVPHIKLLEYLASGRPTVATRLASILDVIEDGKNGILVEPNRPRQLAQGIMKVLRDESLRTRLGYYGRQTIDNEMTWAYSAQKAVQAYEDILSRRWKSV